MVELTVFSFFSALRVRMVQIALENDIDFKTCLDQVKEARKAGLTTPVILMGERSATHLLLGLCCV